MIKLMEHNGGDILVNMDCVISIRKLTRKVGILPESEYKTSTLITFISGSSIQVVETIEFIQQILTSK